ncbi:hypothetical protein ACIQW5_26020 [Methylorubrum thiocyanatum]|uniref:hypothetical protein n=1 Tax=Methylorubrum thiocyanatum TaxID=47958 RepID=UPI00383B0DC1
MTTREFWWVTSTAWNLPEPTPAHVSFTDGVACEVRVLGQEEWFASEHCTLIERIALPRTRDADLPAVASFHG